VLPLAAKLSTAFPVSFHVPLCYLRLSMTSEAYLAIDLGASGGRVIAGQVHGGQLKLETSHRFSNGPVRMRKSLVWDSVGLWQHILTGLSTASGQYLNVASIGVDTWGVDYVLIDADDVPLGPAFNYRDSRTTGMYDRAFSLVPRPEIFACTGIQFMEINTLYQLLSQSLAGSPALQHADAMLLMGDFFHWLLTGKRSVEVTNASTTQLLDPTTGAWSLELIERLGLPARLFAPPIESGTNLGPLDLQVADATGLHDVPVIIPATHDTASAVLAVPAETFAPAQPDWCYISSGTWSLMGCEIPHPIINETVAAYNFTNERGVRGSTRLLKNIGGLWIFQQIRAALQRRGISVTWDTMVRQAEAAQPLSLLIDPDAQVFVAPPDMIDAISAFAEATGQATPSDHAALYRAALEGLALRYRSCLSSLEKIVGRSISTIHVVGGGSLNSLLCQMTADACNRTVVAGPVEATATGNVLMQMIGLGRVSGVDEARALVRTSFAPTIYHPRNIAPWDAAAAKFDVIVAKSH
jgi:rhamnulokinase